jgi:hypothetical protein
MGHEKYIVVEKKTWDEVLRENEFYKRNVGSPEKDYKRLVAMLPERDRRKWADDSTMMNKVVKEQCERISLDLSQKLLYNERATKKQGGTRNGKNDRRDARSRKSPR